MLYADSIALPTWRPDFSGAELPDPEWTRLFCGDVELCNGIEWVEWACEDAQCTDPASTQVELCDVCGTTGCASGGWVLIGRVSNGLLWTAPRDLDFGERSAALLRRNGPAFLPAETWEIVRAQVPTVPALDAFPALRAGDLLDAWLLDLPPAVRAGSLTRDDLLRALKTHAVASDTLDADALGACIDELVAPLRERLEAPVRADLRPCAEPGCASETIYWDQGYIPPWTGLAQAGATWQFGFGEGLACLLETGPAVDPARPHA